MLIKEGRLSTPILYLSGYLEANRQEYYDRLQAVREVGDMDGWLNFFLRAVCAAAKDAESRAGRLVQLRERYYAGSRLDQSRVSGLIPLIFSNPFLTAKRVQVAVGGTDQGARNLLNRATDYGWIGRRGTIGRGGALYWVAQDVLRVVESPILYVAQGMHIESTGSLPSPDTEQIATSS